MTSIIEIFEKKFFFSVECFRKTAEKPSKTTIKPINLSAFESRDYGLSNYVEISKWIFLTKKFFFDPGGALKHDFLFLLDNKDILRMSKIEACVNPFILIRDESKYRNV